MSRAAPTLAFAHLVLACSASIPPDFESRYESREGYARCLKRIEYGSGTTSYGGHPVEIERDADDVYTLELPSIVCPLHATRDGDELHFPPQDCASADRAERDIHGTASWNDDDELVIEVESTEYWHPLADFWPDGLVWDCLHDYVLTPSP